MNSTNRSCALITHIVRGLAGILMSGSFLVPVAAAADFKPVVVLHLQGQAPEAVKAKIAEAVTGEMRRAILRVYAREVYGTGKNFRPKEKHPGALGILGKVFQDYDRNMELRFRRDLKPVMAEIPQGQNLSYQVEVMWTSKNLPQADRLVEGGMMFGFMWQMAHKSVFGRVDQDPLATLADLPNIAVVQAKDVPGGIQSMYDEGAQVYAWARKDNNGKIVPLVMGAYAWVGSETLKTQLSMLVKPADLNMKLDPPEPEDFIQSEALIQQPPYYSQTLPVWRLIYERTYRSQGQGEKPVLRASFGQMATQDVRSLTSCFRKCSETGNAGPVHVRKLAPTVPGKLRVPDTITGAKRKAMEAAVDTVNGYLDLFVMMNEIVMDVSDPEGIRVIPERSRIPMVIRITDPLRGQHYYDITQDQFGFDFMRKLVASEAAKEMTLALRGALSDADGATNKQFAGIVNRIQEMFR